ncbi:MAG: nucleoid-associated protein [Alistipes sp.]|jgi:nucleoid-associated protein YejK|nr:nucleoid-associated protein [Alistipes sp.]
MVELKKRGHNIDLKNIVIHRITKTKGLNTGNIKCNQAVLPITDVEKQFIARITDSFQKNSSPTYGTFNGENDDFNKQLCDFKDKKCEFLKFTRNAMFLYRKVINASAGATGAFMVFAHYKNTTNNNFYFLILAIDNKPGYSLNDSLTIKSIQNLDLSKIDLACRINLSRWQNFLDNKETDSKTYLAFVKGKKGISDYFMNKFVGCCNKQTNEVASVNLLNAINGYCKQKEYDEDKTKEVRSRVFRHAMDRMTANQEILLDSLSAIVNGDDPREFAEFAGQEEYGVGPIISGHKKTLQNLQVIRFKDKKMTLEIDASLIGETVFYDKTSNTLKIEQVPVELANQFS